MDVPTWTRERCSRQVAPPIALAQLVTFKLGEGELVSLDRVACTFDFGAATAAHLTGEQKRSAGVALSSSTQINS
jgi:hypothetical protein